MIRLNYLFAFILVHFILVISSNPISKSESESDEPEVKYRLPNNTIPVSYNIDLTTNVHKNETEFTGVVTITLKAVEETNYITIHKRQTEIENVLLTKKDGSIIELEEEEKWDNVTEKLTFTLQNENEKLEKDQSYDLTIKYKGNLRDDNGGFYKSTYTNEEGIEVWLATTQFESTDARHAFPCYDEPGIRAEFKVTIRHGKDYEAISNTPVMSRTVDGEMATTKFEPIKSMQPYILAFVVSDFHSIKRERPGVIPQGIYSRPQYIKEYQAEFGLLTGERVLTELQDYFDIPYDLKKMDQISVPDFQAGAMENWGLVTYREDALLYNEKKSAFSQRRRVSEIVAHEFAHQFFGNLVSPAWWSYLWLNEGFANYYQYRITDMVYPEFRSMEFFIVENQQKALRSDALETTRPMTFYVEEPIAIRNLFDDVAYAKSGSVLRMLNHAFTEKIWQNGLHKYLENMRLKSATSDDLAKYVQEAIDEDKESRADAPNAKAIIDSWSTNTGYPVVKVERTKDNKLKLTQSRFTYKIKKDKEDDPTWMIPITIATAKGKLEQFMDTKPIAWMENKDMTIESSEKVKWDAKDWIILNKQQSAFYRVDYDQELWKLIINKLKSDSYHEIHDINRAQLIDDMFNLARVNKINYSQLLDLLLYLKKENRFAPWASANNAIAYPNLLMGKSENFEKFIRELTEALYNELGINDLGPSESLADKYVRTVAINLACGAKNKKCLDETKAVFEKFIKPENQEDIAADLRYNVLCSALKGAKKEDFDKIMKKFTSISDQADRLILIRAMGCVQDSNIQNEYLKMTLTEEPDNEFRIQEKNSVLQSVYSSSIDGMDAAIKFIDANHEKIQEGYNPPSPVKNSVLGMAQKVASKEQQTKFEALLDKLITAEYFEPEEKPKILEVAKENIQWIDDNQSEIENYLKEYYKNGAIIPSISIFTTALLLLLHFIFN